MRDIYLIDFENVASEGLGGITFLSPEDEVIIFYSNNSNRLSMKMHILIGKSICKLHYFEVTVGGKNALDHQISTWLGYLVGTKAADRNYYIVSKDLGYKFVASFWNESAMKPTVRCIDSIRAASRSGRSRKAAAPAPAIEPQAEAPAIPAETPAVPEVLAAVPTEATAPAPDSEPVPAIAPAEEQPAAEEAAPVPPPEAVQPAPVEALEPTPAEVPAASEETQKPAAKKRSFFGVTLPDWTPQAPAVIPVEQEVPARKPEAPKEEPEKQPEPAETLSTQNSAPAEAPREAEEIPAESKGEWPPLADSPEPEGTDTGRNGRSRNHTRSRSRRSKAGRGVAREPRSETVQEPEQQIEAPRVAPEEQPEPEKKPARQNTRRAAPKAEQKPAPQADQKPAQKKPEARSRQKKTEPRPAGKKPDISGLIAPYPGLQEAHLQQLIAEGKKQILCNTLRKQLGQEKGLALYNEIKKLAWK